MERKEIDESSARCKKCYQLGHFTYQCTNERKYLQRPSRTKLIKKQLKDQERLRQKVEENVDLNGQEEQDENLDKEKEEQIKNIPDDSATSKESMIEKAKNEKLEKTIEEMNREIRSNQESISKVMNIVEKERKLSSASKSSSSSDLSSSSSSSSSSSESSSSSSSESSSSSSDSDSSSDSSSRKKRHKKRPHSREKSNSRKSRKY